MLNSESILLVGALALVFSGKGLGFGQLARVDEGWSLMPTIFCGHHRPSEPVQVSK